MGQTWQFGYVRDGQFYRKSVSGADHADCLAKFNAETKYDEIVSVVQI